MTKFLECIACKVEERGIKSRVSMGEHTCGRFGPGYKPPQIIYRGPDGLPWFKVLINRKIAFSKDGKSGLFSLKMNQWVNGYKISAGQEVWFTFTKILEDNFPHGTGVEHFIWVRHDEYKKLRFAL